MAFAAKGGGRVPNTVIPNTVFYKEIVEAGLMVPGPAQGLCIGRTTLDNHKAEIRVRYTSPADARRAATIASRSPETKRKVAAFLVPGFWDGKAGAVEESLRNLQITTQDKMVIFATHFERRF